MGMIAAKFSDDEDARLQELLKYEILDTPDEQEFEDVVKLASHLCGASIGLVTFVDDCRQWFKAKVGWEYKETTRDISFCAHTIHSDRLMEIKDTLEDSRFCHNPLVLEGPKVRFYAGVPLTSPRGYKLGTLCVLDDQPRELSEKQQFGLEVLAKYIVQLLELRLKKQSLQESQREYSSLREKMHRQQRALTRAQRAARIGMFEVDLPSRRLRASEGLCHLFGIKLTSEMDVEECLSLVHPNDVAGLHQYFTATLQSSSRRFVYDYRCLKKNTRKEIYVRAIGEVVRNEEGVAIQLIGVKQDITEQKWYERQLEEQNAVLMKVNQELDNFVYRVSHDLRSPISSLLGLTEIISNEQDITKIKELLLLVKKTLEKQDKFIKDILDYSRNSRQEVVGESIDFEELLEELFSQYAYNSQYEKVEFTYTVEQEVPFATDLYRLKIILNNLVSNSFKYLKPGRESSYVRVRVQVVPAGATIVVEDNGVGIELKHQKKVFDMFYRATDMHPGSGLGLYIARETAAKLKGEVSLKSQPGEGTSITVYLPDLHHF
jgi:PAS domain S-box-containing protein